MQYATFLLLFLLMAPALRAERFEFTPDVRTAYEQVTSLRFTEARATLARIKKQDPGNLVAYHIENYLDFLNLYLNQSPADYKRLKTNEEIRIAKIQRGDANSPYYLYAQADIRLQWALVKLRFGDYLAGFNDVSKAHKLLKKNQEKFPDFLPNRKDLGVLYALAGTVPDNYKWGGASWRQCSSMRSNMNLFSKPKPPSFMLRCCSILRTNRRLPGAYYNKPISNPTRTHCIAM